MQRVVALSSILAVLLCAAAQPEEKVDWVERYRLARMEEGEKRAAGAEETLAKIKEDFRQLRQKYSDVRKRREEANKLRTKQREIESQVRNLRRNGVDPSILYGDALPGQLGKLSGGNYKLAEANQSEIVFTARQAVYRSVTSATPEFIGYRTLGNLTVRGLDPKELDGDSLPDGVYHILSREQLNIVVERVLTGAEKEKAFPKETASPRRRRR